MKFSLKRLFKGKRRKNAEMIINLYHTNYNRSVLISYITAPFFDGNHFRHQNYITSHIIAETFSELGYDVDVVDYYSAGQKINYYKYSVFFGFGYNLEMSFYCSNRSVPRIHFITGAHKDLQNSMSLRSVKEFYELSGLWLPNEANVLLESNYYAMFNADSAIILAHGFVLEDCKSRFENEVYSLNNNILNVFENFGSKTKENRRPDFLFLSGGKQITKGLHLLLEVSKIRPELNFYVVVPFMDEVFENYYAELFTGNTNVFLYKSIRMDSDEMKQIIQTCSYIIAPSYIDGLPGGTIEPMSAGLIPVVSKYCGFPDEKFIFEMEELSVECLSHTISKVLALDDETYIKYSNAAKTYVQNNFSAGVVKESLKKILTTELSEFSN